MTTDTSETQQDDLSRRWLSDLKPVAVLGFLAYVALRLAYGRFYAQFGLSPDDLRPGYVELLTQSTIGVIFMTTVSGLLVVGCTGFGVEYHAFLKGIGDERSWRWRLWWRVASHPWEAILVGAALLDTALVWVAKQTGDRRLGFWCSVVFVLYLLLVVALGMTRLRNGLVRKERGWRRLAVAMLLVTGVTAAALLIDDANFDAQQVRGGWPAGNTVFGIPLTSWGAQTATLSWTTDQIDPALRPLADSCLMYLGQSDGTLFLYSPHGTGSGTFRVPADAASIRILPNQRCQPEQTGGGAR